MIVGGVCSLQAYGTGICHNAFIYVNHMLTNTYSLSPFSSVYVQSDAFFTANYRHLPVDSNSGVHTRRSTCSSAYLFI